MRHRLQLHVGRWGDGRCALGGWATGTYLPHLARYACKVVSASTYSTVEWSKQPEDDCGLQRRLALSPSPSLSLLTPTLQYQAQLT